MIELPLLFDDGNGNWRDGGSPCSDCSSICCREETRIELTPTEAETIRNGNAAALELLPPHIDEESEERRPTLVGRFAAKFLQFAMDPRSETYSWYRLTQDCAFLDESGCSIKFSESRPDHCEMFTAGGADCRDMRKHAGKTAS